MNARVVHLTTVHSRDDNRIVGRECAALVDAGYEVHLVVCDGHGDAELESVQVHDLGRPSGRARRMTALPLKAISKVRNLAPAIVHFHDPELLPFAITLRSSHCKVIYDAHEDLPRSIMSKEWIPAGPRKLVGRTSEVVENFCATWMDAVVAATPIIARRFLSRAPMVETICNFPRLSDASEPNRFDVEPRTFCYVGAISTHRGINEMIAALPIANARLFLAGSFESDAHFAQTQELPGWERVEYLGVVAHDCVWDILARSVAGLLFLHPVQNYIESLPTKLYEYMASALPILASDYAGWPDLIREEEIGLTCDPLDPRAIAELMKAVMNNPAHANEMGRRGRRLVLERFRWENEADKLVNLYRRLLQAGS